jgi:hypothetical protein
MQNRTDIHGFRVRAVGYSSGKEAKGNQARKRTKIGQWTRIVQTTKRLIKLHPLRYLTQAAVNRHPPPPFLAPHHAAGNPTVSIHAGTSGATHSQQIIQRAATMRVTRCAHAGSDSRGTMPVAQMSLVPPADSPFRSRSYATFVTDLELQQARAEMEECYRRRARRLGLEDTLPVGRPMTDEEIEDLQWQGNWGTSAQPTGTAAEAGRGPNRTSST